MYMCMPDRSPLSTFMSEEKLGVRSVFFLKKNLCLNTTTLCKIHVVAILLMCLDQHDNARSSAIFVTIRIDSSGILFRFRTYHHENMSV